MIEMMHVIFNFQADPQLATKLAQGLGWQTGQFTWRKFPDGESYIRIDEDVCRKAVAVVTDLSHPDERFLPLLLFAGTLRDLGAEHITLIAPYLPYMRQDKQFASGEGVTSRYFAGIVSTAFDSLVTVDPHLHRYGSLDEIYTIPAVAGHAAPLVADWLKNETDQPLLIGPDSESEQWVREVARLAGAPFLILEKIRHGDRDVEIHLPQAEADQVHTPVLIDDIVSSGSTMLETAAQLRNRYLRPPICIAVHGLLTDDAYKALSTRTARVVTTNTVPHTSNSIDICPVLIESVRELATKTQGAGSSPPDTAQHQKPPP